MTARAETERRLLLGMRTSLGPLVCSYLDDPGIIEVMLNPDGQLWVDRLGVGMECVGRMERDDATSVISTAASLIHTQATREKPILECELPIRGARFEAVLPPVASAPTFAIRLKATRVFSLTQYVAAGIMSDAIADAIYTNVAERKNILIAGGTGSGKTTLGNAILQVIAEVAPSDRIVVLEDTIELQCPAENVVSLRTSEHVDMQRLLKATMRLRPDRIVVGEVRDGAALSMLKAWGTGHPGGLCTIHANSAMSALTRVEQLVAEVTPANMRAVIADAVDLIIPIKRFEKSRLVTSPLHVRGIRNGEYEVECKDS